MTSIHSTSKIIAAGLMALGLGLFAAPARAQDVTTTQMVPFGDLNLGSQAGLRTLQRRIELASRQVCDSFGTPVSLEQNGEAYCVAKAKQDAQARLAPMIAAARLAGVFAAR